MKLLADQNVFTGDNVTSLALQSIIYYHSFSGPNVCLARFQMELCRAANIFAAR